MERKKFNIKIRVINIICVVISLIMCYTAIMVDPFIFAKNASDSPSVSGLGFIFNLFFLNFLIALIALSIVNLVTDKKHDKIYLTNTIVNLLGSSILYFMVISESYYTLALNTIFLFLQIFRLVLIIKNNKAVKLQNLENKNIMTNNNI